MNIIELNSDYIPAEYLKAEKAEYEESIQKLTFHINYNRTRVRLWQKHIALIDKMLIDIGELKPEDSTANLVAKGELTFTQEDANGDLKELKESFFPGMTDPNETNE